MKTIPGLVNFIFIGVIITLMISCKSGPPAKEDSSGGTLEILVVTDNKAQWEGTLGDTIRSFFGQSLTALPQEEPLFTMAALEKSAFSKMFQAHHNIFIVSIDRNRAAPLVETKKDLWAQPQRVIKVTVPNEHNFFDTFNKYKESFYQLFYDVEIERTNKSYSTVPETDIRNKLKKEYNISLRVPVGYRIARQLPNFVWLRRETTSFGQGISICFESYTDTNQFSPGYILARRDSVMKYNIPGPSEGSFMTTSGSVISPEFERIHFNGNFAVKTRGLWETRGDWMGGPFISYTTVDELQNRIVTIEGYVYAPNAKKALLLHQLDAILHTLKFSGGEKQE